ncbi:MAG TPA: response regulator transcription factor [Rhizobacter sp.]|nr:response regulator transcription factor [Rhizobacter sp.]
MPRVLVVEDEPAILESLGFVLERDGFEPQLAGSLERADEILAAGAVDLVVLDLMLPDGSGFDLIGKLRSTGRLAPPLIVLSSRDSETDRVRALEMGADDYVTKPFSPREVLARVRAVLRRTERAVPDGSPVAAEAPELRHLPRFNPTSRRAAVGDTPLDLTRVEFDLMALFFGEPGRAFSRAEIIDQVWGSGFALSDRTIDSHIKALRKKLTDAGGDAGLIETVRGIGYRGYEPSSRP